MAAVCVCVCVFVCLQTRTTIELNFSDCSSFFLAAVVELKRQASAGVTFTKNETRQEKGKRRRIAAATTTAI